MTVAFILCASLLSRWIGFGVYFGVFAVYCLINYKSIAALFKNVFKKKQKVAPEPEVLNAEEQGTEIVQSQEEDNL